MNNPTEINELNRVIESLACQIKGIAGENDNLRDTTEEQNKTIRNLNAKIAEKNIYTAERIEELKTSTNWLRLVLESNLTILEKDKTTERLEKNLHDTNIALDESRKIAREYHKKCDSLEGVIADYEKTVCRLVATRASALVLAREINEALESKLAESKQTNANLNTLVDERDLTLDAYRTQKIESLESDLLLCQGANAANNRLIAKQYKTLKSFWNDRNELRDILNEAGVIVNDDTIQPYHAIEELADVLVDYLDAPDGAHPAPKRRASGDLDVIESVHSITEARASEPSYDNKKTLDDIEMSARNAELNDYKKRLRMQTVATKYLEGRLDTYKKHVSKQRTMLDEYHEMIADRDKHIDEIWDAEDAIEASGDEVGL